MRFDPVCKDCAKLMSAQPNGMSQGGFDDWDVLSAGGAWNSTNTDLLLSNYQHDRWYSRSDTLGFRCARDVQSQ